MSGIEELAQGFNPAAMADPSAMENLLNQGIFEPKASRTGPPSRRLETLLALIEGWVETVVTAALGDRLPGATRAGRDAAAASHRRPRGEDVRHARRPGTAAAQAAQAARWAAPDRRRQRRGAATPSGPPDLLPGAADLDEPAAFIDRVIGGGTAASDAEMERAIAPDLERSLREDPRTPKPLWIAERAPRRRSATVSSHDGPLHPGSGDAGAAAPGRRRAGRLGSAPGRAGAAANRLTAPALATVLRTMHAMRRRRRSTQRGPSPAWPHRREELTDLVDALVAAGVPAAPWPPAAAPRHPGPRPRPLAESADRVAAAVRRRVAHTSQSHVVIKAANTDLMVLTDQLVADPRVLRELHEAGWRTCRSRIRDGVGLVGPMVLPGATACLDLDLHRSDHDEAWPAVAASCATPSGPPTGPPCWPPPLALGQIEEVIRAIRGQPDRPAPATLSPTLEFDVSNGRSPAGALAPASPLPVLTTHVCHSGGPFTSVMDDGLCRHQTVAVPRNAPNWRRLAAPWPDAALELLKRPTGASRTRSTPNSRRRPTQLFTVLGELKGSAMKVGQALSVMETAVPEQFGKPPRGPSPSCRRMPAAAGGQRCTACWTASWAQVASASSPSTTSPSWPGQHRPGAPRGVVRRPRRRGQDPVPRGRRGTARRPEDHEASRRHFKQLSRVPTSRAWSTN